MKCPKCGSEGRVVSFEFRAWGVCPPQTLYQGKCEACGFAAHQSASEKRAAAWFIEGMTRNPDFDQWREAQARIDAAKAAQRQ